MFTTNIIYKSRHIYIFLLHIEAYEMLEVKPELKLIYTAILHVETRITTYLTLQRRVNIHVFMNPEIIIIKMLILIAMNERLLSVSVT